MRTLYSDANLGCRKRISGGLDWVFEQEEEAIILEDDCLPHPTFFRFCEELLDYYRDDRRIMIISGTNQRLDHRFVKHSYLFGSTGHIWGWASWRRAWKYYDVDMRVWPQVRKEKWLLGLNSTLRTRQTVRQWEKALDDVYSGRVDTWDWQWNLACWLQRGASIIAAQNLVSNIGFGAASTHTGETSSADSERLAYEARFPLTHPLYMAGDALYEQEPRDVEYRFQALKHKIKFRSDGARRFRRFSGS
ncbi:MAG: glycosyltransferase family 2 protein [Chthoniobacterales bacterium]